MLQRFGADESASQNMQVLRTGHPESAAADFHALRQEFIPPTHKPEHQHRIADAYADELNFAHVADRDEIAIQDFSLSIPLYVKRNGVQEEKGVYETRSLAQLWREWEVDEPEFWVEINNMVDLIQQYL
jgi:type I restriction-modification system DNA methylase subunit